VDRSQRIVRQNLLEQVEGVARDHQSVAQIALGQTGGGKGRIPLGNLDAHEVAIRRGCRGRAKKEPLARADLNLQGRLAAEQGRRIPRSRQLLERTEVEGEIQVGRDPSQRPATIKLPRKRFASTRAAERQSRSCASAQRGIAY